jgi:hypothetical protein
MPVYQLGQAFMLVYWGKLVYWNPLSCVFTKALAHACLVQAFMLVYWGTLPLLSTGTHFLVCLL